MWPRQRHPIPISTMLLSVWLWPASPGAAQQLDDEQPLNLETLAELSLEDLMNVQVTSLAGVEQAWFDTPAAMYVITGDDVRRNGYRSIAEALRLAPGVFVGQSFSHTWSIGMRGFNGSLANKTLVLIDGRAVYDPLLGGTFWNVQDVLLEDIDRIEVIRGPGSTLWGANAVNGVINIRTKGAADTQGLFLQAGLGTYERGFGSIRYGVQVDEDSWLRVYGKWLSREHLVDATGAGTHDDWEMARAGFRFDRNVDAGLTLTVQGDVYHSDNIGEFTMNAPVPGQSIVFVDDIRNVPNSGGNLLMRLAREDADRGWTLQAYYDRTERVSNVQFRGERDTLDVDWRHHFKIDAAHDIIWGLGARHTRDETEDGYSVLIRPRHRSLDTFSAFVQDTITLEADQWFAMIGSKFEHNDHTGFEIQPSARMWWTPDDRSTLWASVSRAVRIPSRSEEGGMIVFGYIDTGVLAGDPPTGVIIPLGVSGNPALEAEVLIAYEAGYRAQLTDDLSFDAALFYNDYDRLIYVPSLIDPFDNTGTGETYGGEIGATWRVADNWELRGSYSYADVQIHGALPADEGNTPHHMAQLRSYLQVTDRLEFNGSLSFVDALPTPGVPAYWRLDLGLIWQVSDHFELALWGQNLTDGAHPEFATPEVERSVYLMGTIRY